VVLRSFLNAITESALLIDRKGRVLTANETAAKRMGTTVPGIIGRMPMSSFRPTWPRGEGPTLMRSSRTEGRTGSRMNGRVSSSTTRSIRSSIPRAGS